MKKEYCFLLIYGVTIGYIIYNNNIKVIKYIYTNMATAVESILGRSKELIIPASQLLIPI